MTEWFEDERFWERMFPVMFSPERFARADQEIVQVMELAQVSGGRALDMACGPGRHAVALARRGFRVTGVDLSPFLLRKARDHAEEAGVDVEWVRQDMRQFVRPTSYDLILNLFTSFGYFKMQVDEVRALKNMVESLSDTGCIVMDMIGKEALAERLPFNRQPTEERDGSLLIQRVDVVDDWCRAKSEWLLVRDDHVERFHFEHTLFSGHELRELMNWAGLSDVKLYGDFDGRPYGPGAQRLFAVGRK